MTPTERLILENQIAIMDAIFELNDVTRKRADAIEKCINKTQRYLNESEGDGGH